MLFKLGSLWHLTKKGFDNIKKNLAPSIASIITMTICILLFGIFYAICANLSNIAGNIESGVTISVFMKEDVTEQRLSEIGNLIRENDAVESVSYISGEQTWNEYKKDYFEGKEELAMGFEEDNPLANSGHYDVHMKDLSKQSDLVTYVASLDGVRLINQSQEVANVFADLNHMIIVFSFAIITMLILVSVFLIQNMISTSINMREKEISIMHDIGATNLFIQYPFIVEAIIIGSVGIIIPLIIFHMIYKMIISYVETRLVSLGNLFSFLPINQIFHVLVIDSLIIGIGISIVGSIIVLHKKIKKVTMTYEKS